MSQLVVLDGVTDTTGIVGEPANDSQSNLEQRINLLCNELEISIDIAHRIDLIFDYEFFQKNYFSTINSVDKSALVESFLSQETGSTVTISPFIDIVTLQNHFSKIYEIDDKRSWTPAKLIALWLDSQVAEIDPWPLFDRAYYCQSNVDVAESDYPPFLHFVDHGAAEGRIPSEYFGELFSNYLKDIHPIDFRRMLRGIPYIFQERFLTNSALEQINELFMPEVYVAGCDSDVNSNNAFGHFLINGSFNEKRPSVLFNREYYIERFRRYEEKYIEDSKNTLNPEQRNQCTYLHIFPFLHWFFEGSEKEIVPTPLFDNEIYMSENRDISNGFKNNYFSHFMKFGINEKSRAHSNYFDPRFYFNQREKTDCKTALIDYVLNGQFQNIPPCRDINIDETTCSDPIQSSLAEEVAIFVEKKVDRLSNGKLKGLVERAKIIEPQIFRPYGRRKVRFAPLIHPEVPLHMASKDVHKKLRKNSYKAIVLIPHCRMAGSAKIAGEYTKSLATRLDEDNILLISTDASHFDRPDWFPENTHFLDLSIFVEKLNDNMRVRLLLDILRGLNPEHVININSRMGWQMTQQFGKQLSSWFSLYAYLFCWDLDERGNQGGYPIQWFLPTFNYLKALYTDSNYLRNEIIEKYALPVQLKNKIVTLHTPIHDKEICYLEHKHNIVNPKRRKRCFWSGRFDRQKRFDILIQIAEKMPDLDIYVWGKKVLNDFDFDEGDLPDNVTLMGTYESIDDIPFAGFDFFLYTAEWDGLPTVLIEVASRGMPVVASSVGGVTDIIDTSTGWPVSDYLSVKAYEEAIADMYDSDEMISKSSNLRNRVLKLCDENTYTKNVSRSIGVPDNG